MENKPVVENKPVYDNGENKLYNSQEIIKTYGLYDTESNDDDKFGDDIKVGLKNIEGIPTKVNKNSKFKTK